MTTGNEYLIEYNSADFLAFKDAPGWYLYQWQRVAGNSWSEAHGYKIIAGPFTTYDETRLELQLLTSPPPAPA